MDTHRAFKGRVSRLCTLSSRDIKRHLEHKVSLSPSCYRHVVKDSETITCAGGMTEHDVQFVRMSGELEW